MRNFVLRNARCTAALAVFGFLAGMVGCGGNSTTSSGGSTPPAQKTISVAGSLSLSSTAGTSASQSVTVTNTGAAAVNITGVTISGTNASDFSETNTCGTQLAVSANCSITVSFLSNAGGTYTASLNIANDASSGGTATVSLSGTAAATAPVLSLSSATLTLPSAVAGGAATTQVETLTNTGNAVLNLTGFTITGTNASNFSITANSCGATLAVNANCAATVSFSAATTGTYAATLNVANNASTGGTAAISLSGTATAPPIPLASLSVSTVAFASMAAGTTSTAQTVKLTNGGTGALTIASVSLSGTDANLFAVSNPCTTTLAAGASCNISVTFNPKVAGSYSATLTVTDNASGTTGSTQAANLSGTATPFTISVNTSNPTAWVIDNGAITFNWNAINGDLNSWILDGYSDQLVDTTTTSNFTYNGTTMNQPRGLYSGMVGPFMSGTPTVACTAVGVTVVGTSSTTTCAAGTGSMPYLDWAITWPDTASASNAYTFVWHYLVFPNDPGVHTYVQLVHNASDIAGSVGQIQWIFRDSLSTFTNSYSVNAGLGILGVQNITLPAVSDTSSSDPGRAVQNAVEDLHGFPDIPGTFGRYFDTKYDFAGYEYLHQAHGLYGPASSGTTYGVWTVLPKLETFVGGPTKQNLFFTGNIDMIEAYSNHEDNNLSLATAAGTASNRLFGPYYIHVNTLGTAYNQSGSTLKTPADMYADAISAEKALVPNYDNVTPLVSAGYTATSGRGSVAVQVSNVASLANGASSNVAWAVLSDPGTNFQYSTQGMQYWADITANGSATFTGVVPGTYRLSVYVLGQWGEYRQDGIVVTANSTTTVPTITFQPENFGTTLFTIGTPDRSSHEFLHGHTANGNDDREFWGNWNYWADFAANQGAVVYYGTAVGSTPATNDLSKWNYVHWNVFNPGLFDPSNDSTGGYSNTANSFGNGIPTYVAGLSGSSGTNGVTTPIPAWHVYFATPSTVPTSGYVDLSISLACGYSSDVIALNGSQRIWHYTNYSDCMLRSGLSGYTQWFVMEWPVSALNQTPGGSNEITISESSSGSGVEDDAMRLEISPNGANPTVTNWNDYTYLTGTNYPGTGTANSSGLYNNDAVPNP